MEIYNESGLKPAPIDIGIDIDIDIDIDIVSFKKQLL